MFVIYDRKERTDAVSAGRVHCNLSMSAIFIMHSLYCVATLCSCNALTASVGLICETVPHNRRFHINRIANVSNEYLYFEYRRNKEQYETELKELAETEQATLRRYQEAQARVRQTEDKCMMLFFNFNWDKRSPNVFTILYRK